MTNDECLDAQRIQWWEGDMKRFAILACAALLMAGGCGSNNTNGPSNQPTVFTVPLLAANETPPTGKEPNASGTATITVNTVKDSSGAVTSGTFDFNVSLTGFPPDSKVILAHIHTGAAGVPGAVLINTNVSAADNIVLTNGSGTFSKTGVAPPSVADLQNILNNPSGFYFNVHTQASPGGAVRGQLR
jgi:hypothetical protein